MGTPHDGARFDLFINITAGLEETVLALKEGVEAQSAGQGRDEVAQLRAAVDKVTAFKATIEAGRIQGTEGNKVTLQGLADMHHRQTDGPCHEGPVGTLPSGDGGTGEKAPPWILRRGGGELHFGEMFIAKFRRESGSFGEPPQKFGRGRRGPGTGRSELGQPARRHGR
jgi:hypothetical protein